MRIVYEQRASTVLFRLLRARRGDAPWALPANVCPIVPLTFLKAGVPFELLDIDAETLSLDVRELLHRVAERPQRYGGCLFVHTYGREQPVAGLVASLRDAAPGFVFVDDRCVLYPSFDEPETSADVTLYSTGYAKPVDIGFGGYAFLAETTGYADDALPYDEADLERLTAMYKERIAARKRIADAPGDWLDTSEPATDFDAYRERVTDEAAAAKRHRAALLAIYDELPPEIVLPRGDWRTHLRVPERDRLVEALFAADLFAGTHYASLAGVFDDARAPAAEALHRDVVNLFNDRYYTAEQARATVAIVKEHVASCR